jgi:hypothetical protein
MEQVELRPSTTPFDRVYPYPKADELPPRNDPVLLPRQFCDRAIDPRIRRARDALAGHTPPNAAFVAGSPPTGSPHANEAPARRYRLWL